MESWVPPVQRHQTGTWHFIRIVSVTIYLVKHACYFGSYSLRVVDILAMQMLPNEILFVENYFRFGCEIYILIPGTSMYAVFPKASDSCFRIFIADSVHETEFIKFKLSFKHSAIIVHILFIVIFKFWVCVYVLYIFKFLIHGVCGKIREKVCVTHCLLPLHGFWG